MVDSRYYLAHEKDWVRLRSDVKIWCIFCPSSPFGGASVTQAFIWIYLYGPLGFVITGCTLYKWILEIQVHSNLSFFFLVVHPIAVPFTDIRVSFPYPWYCWTRKLHFWNLSELELPMLWISVISLQSKTFKLPIFSQRVTFNSFL